MYTTVERKGLWRVHMYLFYAQLVLEMQETN
jgi:hypothetical protein